MIASLDEKRAFIRPSVQNSLIIKLQSQRQVLAMAMAMAITSRRSGSSTGVPRRRRRFMLLLLLLLLLGPPNDSRFVAKIAGGAGAGDFLDDLGVTDPLLFAGVTLRSVPLHRRLHQRAVANIVVVSVVHQSRRRSVVRQ